MDGESYSLFLTELTAQEKKEILHQANTSERDQLEQGESN